MRTSILVVGVLLLGIVACSSNGDDDGPGREAVTPTTTAVAPAVLEGPVTVGQFSGPADPRPVDLDAIGYVQEEFFASGTATRYTSATELRADGRWTAEPAGAAPYKTRVVVRRPASTDRFSGTVVVEWLNVSAVEAAPDWAYTNRAIVDAGAAWIGVSVQALGVVGGAPLIQTGDARQDDASGGIKANNPERYGSLAHPGDQYAFDIYSQIGAAIRSPGDVDILGSASARHVIAAGESQSAGFLTTYVNAIQPVARVYDGFFVHSRGSGAAQLDGTRPVRGDAAAYRFRPDLNAPVLVFETETDVGPPLRYALARQPDNARLRTWEVAGTAHADAYLVGGQFALCPYLVNSGPQHWVATAGLEALIRWVEDGTAPPRAPRLETTGDGTTIMRDGRGIARGGIRTPSVDAPVAALTGAPGPDGPALCVLFGQTIPFDAATIRSMYPTRDAYLAAFDAALDKAVASGFVRRADRAAYAAEARAFEFPLDG